MPQEEKEAITRRSAGRWGWDRLVSDVRNKMEMDRWTDAALADAAGVSKGTVFRLRSKGAKPWLKKLVAITEVLGLTLDYYIPDPSKASPEAGKMNARYGASLSRKPQLVLAIGEDALILLQRAIDLPKEDRDFPTEKQLAGLLGEFRGLKTALCGVERGYADLPELTRLEMRLLNKQPLQDTESKEQAG